MRIVVGGVAETVRQEVLGMKYLWNNILYRIKLIHQLGSKLPLAHDSGYLKSLKECRRVTEGARN